MSVLKKFLAGSGRTSILENKKPSKAKKQAWMKKLSDALTELKPSAAGKIDWNTATHLFNQGVTPVEAAKTMAESSFKLSDRLRAVAGLDRLPKLGESETVEVDDFARELAGVKHSRPGLTEAKLSKTEIRALTHLSTTISRHVDNIPGKITVFEKLEKKGYAKVAKWPLVLATAEGKKKLAGAE